MEHDFEQLPQTSAPTRRRKEEPPSLASAAGNAAMTRLILHRRAVAQQGSGPLDPEIETDIKAATSGGSPLPADTRTDMEGHLGLDLGAVRVHSDQEAHTLSRAVRADAFTVGTHVFFDEGKYAPASSTGRELLAHELVHVRQQALGQVDGESRVTDPGEASERDASSEARTIASSPAGTSVHRHADEDGGGDEDASHGPVMRQAPEEEEELMGDEGGTG